MCTRPTPSWRSVPTSVRALGLSLLAVIHAAAALLLALLSSPLRWLWPSRWSHRPAALAHIEVQIHLGDPDCVAELEAIIWKTLARAERTWAPLALPVDRVVVGAGFPASGRADIYDDYLGIADDVTPGNASTLPERRVVISLGVRDGTRDLDGWEIAGALAAQIQVLVDDRCRQHKSLATPAPEQRTVAPVTTRLTRPTAAQQPPPAAEVVSQDSNGTTAQPSEHAEPWTGHDLPTLAELSARMQESQPLVAAGPTSNGTHP
jgi:hypothetical protein